MLELIVQLAVALQNIHDRCCPWKLHDEIAYTLNLAFNEVFLKSLAIVLKYILDTLLKIFVGSLSKV